jgi:hypothetical protein
MLWGAFGVTLFGIFLTPVFFHVIRRFAGPVRRPDTVTSDTPTRAYGVTALVSWYTQASVR